MGVAHGWITTESGITVTAAVKNMTHFVDSYNVEYVYYQSGTFLC